jgi:hypothetical protein
MWLLAAILQKKTEVAFWSEVAKKYNKKLILDTQNGCRQPF